MISINLKKRLITSFFLLISVFLIFQYNFFLIFSLLILGVLSILEFSQLSKKIFKNRLNFIFINFFFILYIFILCYFFIFFTNFVGLKILIFIILLGCISSDIGGFVFGKIFKGPKLTKISPNKTFSGALGSIIFTLIVMGSLFLYLLNIFDYKILIISVVTSISCQLGDLIFSYLKRKARLKDTGNYLPGHGGILDRLDGILIGLPFGFLTLIILN
tara:strand:- start:4031 stop:4681 length:651 start_codon:yes stop_codon:yes gene_type:complete